MVRIPSEYQEVEYLESTGTQWIDLPFGFLPTDEIETVFSVNTSENNTWDKYIVSPIEWNTNENRFAMGVHRGGYYTAGYGGIITTFTILTPNTLNDGNLRKWSYKNSVFSMPDIGCSVDVTSVTFVSETVNLRLFYGYNSNTKGKIAYYHHKKADGTEVNLIPCYRKSDSEPGMYDTVSGTFYTNAGTGTFLVGNDVSWDTASLLESRRRILLNTPHVETVSDTVASFETDVATKIKGCKVYFTPIQEGEGDPSPENVRPIHGWDGVTVTACGKNLAEKIYGLDSNGADALSTKVTERGEDGIASSLIPVRSGYTYKMSCTGKTASARHFWFDDYPLNDPKPVSIGGAYSISGSYTAPENAKWLFVVWTRQENVNTCGDVQIELGSTATDYEPYIATTLTIPFNRTIYGGYVDLVKGEVVEEYGSADLSTIGFAQYSTTNHCWSNGITNMVLGNKLGAGSLYCDSYKPYPTASILWGGINLAIWGYNTTQRRVIIRNDAYRGEDNIYDMTTFLESLKGAMLYYPLAIPNTYQITPQTLKALRGMNNIWSDANGNIEVSFYTH